MHSAPDSYVQYPGAADRPLSPGYRRREPDKTALYQIVSEHLETCLDQARDRSEHGYGYPRFVEREFEKFLDCGILRRGFVRVRCSDCPSEKLVAYSCKCRGICPSCAARRMANTAAHLVDNVLPHVPYRQFVFSFPKRVRFLLARDHDLLTKVLHLCLRKVFAWQRRRARALGLVNPMCGAVTFVQRFGSLLNLNCHFHALLPDGVFVDNQGAVDFSSIPPPWPDDIDRLVHQIARATEKLITRHTQDCDSDQPPDLLDQEQAHNIQAARFATSHRDLARPKPRNRSAFLFGYSLHAERYILPDDRDGLERLCRYGARAPVANSRLSLDLDGNAIIDLKRPLHDGRTRLSLHPVELLRKLAILIPPPGKNLTRYHGIFGPAHPLRSAVVPAAPRASGGKPEHDHDSTATPRRPDRFSWPELLRRVFAIDILRCDRCGGSMKIIAVIPESDVSDRILDHLGLELPNGFATGPPC